MVVAIIILIISIMNVPSLVGPARAIIAIIIVVTGATLVIIYKRPYPPFI